jgi:hypothetical protein
MSKGYLYLASDGIKDFYKFGITNCLNTRLISYNTTEHLRPIKFLETYEFDTYSESRDVETKLRNVLKKYIIQSNHDEIFKVTKKSIEIFYETVKNCNNLNFKNRYIGNIQNEFFDYHQKVIQLVTKYKNKGVSSSVIEELIIKNKVGYFRENARPRIIMEDRIKDLMVVNKKMICWDNKPKHSVRINRYYNLEEDLKLLIS